MDQSAAESELLLHAARELARRPVREGIEPGGAQQPVHPPTPLGRVMAIEPGKEIEILRDAQFHVEVLAQPLRHIGSTGKDFGAMPRLCH